MKIGFDGYPEYKKGDRVEIKNNMSCGIVKYSKAIVVKGTYRNISNKLVMDVKWDNVEYSEFAKDWDECYFDFIEFIENYDERGKIYPSTLEVRLKGI